MFAAAWRFASLPLVLLATSKASSAADITAPAAIAPASPPSIAPFVNRSTPAARPEHRARRGVPVRR